MQSASTRRAGPSRARPPGARPSGAVAAALPHDGFEHAAAFAAPPPQHRPGERLAWPVAASAIIGASAALWLGIAALARLILG